MATQISDIPAAELGCLSQGAGRDLVAAKADTHFERVVELRNAAAGLTAFVAIHSTALGPGLGGARMFAYHDRAAAIGDVCNLARGMSYKNALADIGFGGGKSVIVGAPKAKTPELLEAFGEGLNFKVKDHPLFERDGQDLLCRVPISYSQAALGAEVDVPTLTGAEKLSVKAGTQPGDVTRLRHKGMPDPNGRHHVGDLLVEIQIEVPKKVEGRQAELLRELAEIEQAEVMPEKSSFFDHLKSFLGGDDKE